MARFTPPTTHLEAASLGIVMTASRGGCSLGGPRPASLCCALEGPVPEKPSLFW